MKQLLHAVRATGAIALNTFRESVRSRVFVALLVFCAAVMLGSLVLGSLSLHNELRVATDVSLFASTVFSAAITVYISITLLHTEIERHTIYTILSKPVRRWQFVLGKFAGILALMAGIVGVLSGATSGLIAVQGGSVSLELLYAFVAMYLQLAILAAISLLFASFSSPLMSGLFSGGVFVLGHLHGQLETVAASFDQAWLRRVADLLEHVVPDLASLNLSVELVRDVPIPSQYMLAAAWYSVSYAAIALLTAMVVFSYRDLS